jgi:uncharacterized protein YjiS (DUF1127 family)
MFAIDQDRVEKSIGHMLEGLVSGLLFIGHHLRLDRVVCWLQDEGERAAVIRELSQLNDHYLRDVGINRSEIEEIADAMVSRRHGSWRVQKKREDNGYPTSGR